MIIEYKRGHSYSVVDQGYTYLSLMLNNKAEFILEYNETTNTHLKRSDIDWSASRVLFVAPSFNSYQKNSINFGDVPFELWEIRRFDDGLIAIEQHQSSSSESIQTVTKVGADSKISEVSSEVNVTSESDHVAKSNSKIVAVWDALRERLAEYADTTFATTSSYISWKRDNTAVCFIHFRKNELYLEVLRGNHKENGEKSKGFFDIDDPKNMMVERSWQWKSGQTGHVYALRLDDEADLDYTIFLLDQKYNSLG